MYKENVPHGLIFIGKDSLSKHTWNDWRIVPTSRPLFLPPSVKTVLMDIPGEDGVLDMTESLTGEVHYNNRTGSMEFQVENKAKWYEVYSDIMDYLHGQQMKVLLDDDQEYYYTGRFFVNTWKSNPSKSTIVIDYDVEPYKLERFGSLEEWEWDPFNFETGIIREYKELQIDGILVFQIESRRKSVVPSFIVQSVDGAGLNVEFKGNTYQLPDGTSRVLNINLKSGVNVLTFTGIGMVSIDYRGGRL